MLNPQPSVTESESVAVLQQQYQASSTIFGSHDPGEILEALVNFLAAGFAYAELGLVDADDPNVIHVLAQIEGGSLKATDFSRQVSEYPASDAIAAIEVLAIPDVETDQFLETEEKQQLINQGTRAAILAPLVTGQQMIGLISLTNPLPLEAAPARLRSLRNLVDQAAIVFENKRLLDAARASADRLEAQVQLLQMLNGVTTGLARFSNQRELLDFATENLTRAAEIDHAGVVLIEPGGEAGIVISEYPDTGTVSARLNMTDNPLFTLAMKTPDQPLVIDDVTHAEILPPDTRDLFARIGIYGVMIVPLVVFGEVIGSLGLDLYSADKRFSKQAVETASLVAAQIAVSLQNIRLYSDAQARAEQLQKIARNEALLNTIVSRYQTISTIDGLLNLTVRELGQALNARRGRVRLQVAESEAAP